MTHAMRLTGCGLVLLFTGCGKSSEEPTPVNTGAKDVVRGFYSAIIGKDWPTAYDAIHPEGRRGWSLERFTQRAQSYRRYLGFEPTRVRVWACEERGTEATAHVELSGQGAGRHVYEDAITLRAASDGRWLVMLPANFGQKP